MSLRGRYLVTFLFTLSLVAAALVAAGRAAGAAEVGVDRRDPARFARDIVALRQAGWTLAELDIHYEQEIWSQPILRVTLVDQQRAHALRFDDAFVDDGERQVSYTRSSVPVPAELRVYADEEALFDTLAQGGVVEKMYEQCGVYTLVLAGAELEIDEHNWYVVKKSVQGASAGVALADELRTRLRGGAHLADVSESQAGVSFQLVAQSGLPQIIDARLDDAGRVVALEVRESPAAWSSGKLASEPKLLRAITRGKAVRRVVLTQNDNQMTRVRIDFAGGKSFVIDMADVAYPEGEGCGC